MSTVSAIDQLIWSVFNMDQVQKNQKINSSFEYDYVISGKRLVIQFHEMPARSEEELNNDDWRVIKIDHPDNLYFSPNRDKWLNEARNQILSYVNTMQVLTVNGGAPLLHPRLDGDAGWDIVTENDVICMPGVGTDIGSNLRMALPNHLYAVVQARSSTSKKNLLVLPGVIDAGYRGQIFVMAYNLSNRPITISKGDRIAQLLIFQRVPGLQIEYVDNLSPSERGHMGFGSTG